jgi:hypothetical protein
VAKSRGVRLHEFSCGFRLQLIGLNMIGEMDDANRNMGPKLSSGGSGSVPSGCVAIHHQDETPEMLQQSALLRLVERGPHQRHHGRHTCLMQLQAVEKACSVITTGRTVSSILARRGEQEINRLAGGIDRPVQIAILPFDADVSFIHPIAFVGALQVN